MSSSIKRNENGDDYEDSGCRHTGPLDVKPHMCRLRLENGEATRVQLLHTHAATHHALRTESGRRFRRLWLVWVALRVMRLTCNALTEGATTFCAKSPAAMRSPAPTFFGQDNFRHTSWEPATA